MLHYLKKYPLSLFIIAIILYLSFFNPPKTDMEEIPYMDKLVHLCMYGGLCLFIWIEYFRSHAITSRLRMIVGGIIAPIALSGVIECLQSCLTDNRSGDWADFIANMLGVFSAAAIGKYVLRPYYRKKKEKEMPTILTDSRHE